VSAAVLIASVALFVIVWTPQLLQQRRAVPGLENADAAPRQNWLSDPVQGHVSHSLQRFAQLPLRLLVDPPDGYGMWGWIGTVPLVIALALIAQRRQRALAFWLLWFGCSAGGLLALDLARSTRLLDFIRYSLIAGAAVCAIVPLLAPRSWKPAWPRLVIPGVVTLLVAIRLPLAYDKPTPDVRSVAAYLDQHAQPNDVVTFFPAEGMDWYAGNAYAGVAHYSRSYPWPFVILSQPADDELMSCLRGHTVWLFSGSDRIPPARILPGAQPLQRQYFEGTGTVTKLSVP